VQKKARERLLELVDPALAMLSRILNREFDEGEQPRTVELNAVRDILNRTKFGAEEEAAGDDGTATWEDFLAKYGERTSTAKTPVA
jgi:hypothetical protein